MTNPRTATGDRWSLTLTGLEPGDVPLLIDTARQQDRWERELNQTGNPPWTYELRGSETELVITGADNPIGLVEFLDAITDDYAFTGAHLVRETPPPPAAP